MTYHNRTHHYPATETGAYIVETSRGYIIMVGSTEVARARSLDSALIKVEAIELKERKVAA